MTTYSDAELERLMLLRQSFSWKVGVEQRAGIWFATYGGRRIRRDDPVSLFDALLLDAAARIGHYRSGDSGRTDAGQESGCTCCRELLEQLAAAFHEANFQILAGLEAARRELTELIALVPAPRQQQLISKRNGLMRSPAAPPTSSPPACCEGTFPGYTGQARNVRGALANWLALEGCPAAIIDNAKVTASELAANAVLHSASRGASFAVRCEIGSGHVRIEVEDLGGPGRPRKLDDRLHGLDLIEALAGSGNWGSEPTGNGHRIVWVRLPREQQ